MVGEGDVAGWAGARLGRGGWGGRPRGRAGGLTHLKVEQGYTERLESGIGLGSWVLTAGWEDGGREKLRDRGQLGWLFDRWERILTKTLCEGEQKPSSGREQRMGRGVLLAKKGPSVLDAIVFGRGVWGARGHCVWKWSNG